MCTLICLAARPLTSCLSTASTTCRYTRLAVVPDNTPLPMTMLRKLWQLASEREAEDCCYMLQQLSILRIAQLYDGSAWALVDATHLKHLQVYVVKRVSTTHYA